MSTLTDRVITGWQKNWGVAFALCIFCIVALFITMPIYGAERLNQKFYEFFFKEAAVFARQMLCKLSFVSSSTP